MVRKLLEYSITVIHHWSSLLTGGIIIALLSLWQGTGHKLPPALYWVVGIVALFIAMFKAWEAERDAKETAISKRVSTKAQTGEIASAWLKLYKEKKRLEDQLEAELESLESLPGPTLRPNMRPDEPYAFYDEPESERAERRKKSRTVDRIKEELGIIKEKLKSAPYIVLDKP